MKLGLIALNITFTPEGGRVSVIAIRGVLSFESYPRTLYFARSAKKFFVRGLMDFVRV